MGFARISLFQSLSSRYFHPIVLIFTRHMTKYFLILTVVSRERHLMNFMVLEETNDAPFTNTF